MGAAIRIDRLTVSYRQETAIRRLSGMFAAGSLTAVVGPNGAGKSTLLAALAGRVRPTSGVVEVKSGSQQQIAYLPQQAEIDRGFPIRILDVVMLGHWGHLGGYQGVSAALRLEAVEALDAVGLTSFGARSIGELSVGQLQRVLFARVLLQDAAVILLDEPFNAIDARTTADLIKVVRDGHGQGRTIIAVLHDLEQVRAHFPQPMLSAREVIAWGDTPQVLCIDNLRQAREIAERGGDHAARHEQRAEA